ncbi:uncharacterized protein L201_006288 [Kwoniella dendrophila CBS 6074]|uniref:PFU domain-containing protein n=1 Tax=Kwoniella dendrophila CBS 6074 TaxID=1295534 RepID=A0AAX4K132_9TREE
MEDSDEYNLSCELSPPHQGDVKAVLAISDDLVASASRDSSVGLWSRKSQTELELKTLLNGHHAYVNSLAYIPSGDFLASGGNSTVILLHSIKTLSPESQHCLIGHTSNVCTLHYSTKHKKLISGSWDQTARVWSKSPNEEWTCEAVLEGHEQAVWGVAIIDEGPKLGCYITADRMIFLWNEKGEIIERFKGSPEPVRSIAILPGGETFATACNDNLVRIWNIQGSVIEILKGHKDYVYQVVLGQQEVQLVSCGEDHTARAWKGMLSDMRQKLIHVEGKKESVILHPCQTVWSVSCMSNGDIVTGGSDGRIRIWSLDEKRISDIQTREVYAKVIEDVTSKHKEGQKDAASQATITIDIDIRISDDEPPLPLVIQAGADPREIAESFGRQHGLSENYINQIEAFIKAHIDPANA